jgi:hypothetical protein
VSGAQRIREANGAKVGIRHTGSIRIWEDALEGKSRGANRSDLPFQKALWISSRGWNRGVPKNEKRPLLRCTTQERGLSSF